MTQHSTNNNAPFLLAEDGCISAYFNPKSENVFFVETGTTLFNCGTSIEANDVDRKILEADPKVATARRGLFSKKVTLSGQKDDERDLPSEISPDFFNATMAKAKIHLKPIGHLKTPAKKLQPKP